MRLGLLQLEMLKRYWRVEGGEIAKVRGVEILELSHQRCL